MKRLTVILLLTFVFLCLVQACAALTYEGTLDTTPSQVGALKPGDEISVSGTIRLPPSGDQTFATKDTLEFYTQLDNAKWSVSIVLGGIENPARQFGGKRVSIGGWELAYPLDNYEEGVKVKFSITEGVVPPSFTSGDIILLRVLEVDSSSNQVGAGVFKNGTVINTAALQTQLDSVKAKLVSLKNDIDAKDALGVDIAAAQAKYQAASTALDTATTKIISSPSEVNNLLATATNNIDDANTALDQAWAQKSLDDAKGMLASVDGLINEFTVNDSLKTSDSRLVAIINKRDLSAQAISSASDYYTGGSYPTARGKAADGLNLANQAWNLSLDLKTELGQGFRLGLPNLGAFLPVILVVAVVLIIAGVIIYRKKTQWDELG
jgi:hypothetical protein